MNELISDLDIDLYSVTGTCLRSEECTGVNESPPPVISTIMFPETPAQEVESQLSVTQSDQ